MRFCAHSVGSRAAALVDEMTAPNVTTSRDRNDRADRHERVDISEEIQNARVWAAVLQQHVVPSPLRARCHNKIKCSLFPLPASQIMSACYGVCRTLQGVVPMGFVTYVVELVGDEWSSPIVPWSGNRRVNVSVNNCCADISCTRAQRRLLHCRRGSSTSRRCMRKRLAITRSIEVVAAHSELWKSTTPLGSVTMLSRGASRYLRGRVGVTGRLVALTHVLIISLRHFQLLAHDGPTVRLRRARQKSVGQLMRRAVDIPLKDACSSQLG